MTRILYSYPREDKTISPVYNFKYNIYGENTSPSVLLIDFIEYSFGHTFFDRFYIDELTVNSF